MTPFLFLFAASAFAQDYLPLQSGNQWIYRQTSGIGQDTWTVEAGAPRTIEGRTYFPVTGFPSRTPLLLRQSGTAVVFYDEADRRERPWADFGVPLNQTFPSEIDPCNATAAVAARDTSVRLPIGEFGNALKLAYQPRCADAGITEDVFVPGAGLAKRTYTTIAGPRVMELIYARIGGFSVYSESEHSFHLTLDAAAYQRGSSITARLTLRNSTGRPLPLVFSSGQDFEIVIRNEAGQQVWRWSDGKGFTAAVREVEFTGERNWVETIRVDLTPGNYAATGSMALTEAKYESTIPFRIEPAR